MKKVLVWFWVVVGVSFLIATLWAGQDLPEGGTALTPEVARVYLKTSFFFVLSLLAGSRVWDLTGFRWWVPEGEVEPEVVWVEVKR